MSSVSPASFFPMLDADRHRMQLLTHHVANPRRPPDVGWLLALPA